MTITILLIAFIFGVGGFVLWQKNRADRKRKIPIDIEAGIRATREAVTDNMLHSWQNNWATASNALMPSMTTQQITGPEISSRLQELASTPKRKRGKKTEKYYQTSHGRMGQHHSHTLQR